jgi:hypothetical protein
MTTLKNRFEILLTLGLGFYQSFHDRLRMVEAPGTEREAKPGYSSTAAATLMSTQFSCPAGRP